MRQEELTVQTATRESTEIGPKQRILIVTCKKLGSGHYSVAKSLEQYLSKKEDVEVYLYNWNWLLGGSTYEFVLAKLPKLLKVGYRIMDSKSLTDFSVGYSKNIMRRHVSKPLDYFDKIILTIPSAQYMGYNDGLSAKTYVVVTDYGEVYNAWGTYTPRIFFVCDQAAATDLSQTHSAGTSQIVISSIPVNEKINVVRTISKLEMREKLGIKSSQYYTIVLGGAGDRRLRKLLNNLLKQDLNGKSFLIVCGRNKKAFETINEMVSESGVSQIKVVGYMPNDELIDHYRASDMVISKPGGITTTELVNLGTPIAIPFFYPVERGNCTFIITEKAGVYHPDLDTFFTVVFNTSENELSDYSKNMARIAKLNSSEIICEHVIADKIS